MENAIFTISETSATFTIGSALNITSKRYNRYNKYNVSKADLFNAMLELADIFNNVIGIGIEFVVE